MYELYMNDAFQHFSRTKKKQRLHLRTSVGANQVGVEFLERDLGEGFPLRKVLRVCVCVLRAGR